MTFDAMAFGPTALPKMMLGFIVRRCTVDMGHQPSPEEFAAWANNYKHGTGIYRLFGRPITADEARVILRHRSRIVTPRGGRRERQRNRRCDLVLRGHGALESAG
jgi:hypothetical protein